MTFLESLIIQLQLILIMIVITFIWAKIINKPYKEFLGLHKYPREANLITFGILFIFWFGVITYYRYILQLPLIGVWGYFL